MVNHKKKLMRLWKDEFSVIESREVTRPNGSTGFEDVVIVSGQPCKLSFSSLHSASADDINAQIRQVTKLFCDNSIEIKPGSKIVVRRGEREFAYKQSGEPGLFSAHQEIVLTPFEEDV